MKKMIYGSAFICFVFQTPVFAKCDDMLTADRLALISAKALANDKAKKARAQVQLEARTKEVRLAQAPLIPAELERFKAALIEAAQKGRNYLDQFRLSSAVAYGVMTRDGTWAGTKSLWETEGPPWVDSVYGSNAVVDAILDYCKANGLTARVWIQKGQDIDMTDTKFDALTYWINVNWGSEADDF